MSVLSLEDVARECAVGGRVVTVSAVRRWIREGVVPRASGRSLRGTGRRVRLVTVGMPGRLAVTPEALDEFLAALSEPGRRSPRAPRVERAKPGEVGTFPVIKVSGRKLGRVAGSFPALGSGGDAVVGVAGDSAGAQRPGSFPG